MCRLDTHPLAFNVLNSRQINLISEHMYTGKKINDNNKAQNANEKIKKRQFFFTIITDKSQYGKTEIIATTYLPFQ